jgi:hypothetical protein
MRKGFFRAVLMIPLLLLAGCEEREAGLEKEFTEFRADVNDADCITVRGTLTADAGDSVERYVLDASYDGKQTTVEIVEPALVAGVKATARWGETEIEYGNVLLGAGALDADGLTPVSAMPAIFAAMAGGYTELLWREGDLIAARMYAGESSRCTVWLTADTLTPVHAEIASDGRTVISCDLTDWQIADDTG